MSMDKNIYFDDRLNMESGHERISKSIKVWGSHAISVKYLLSRKPRDEHMIVEALMNRKTRSRFNQL